MPRSSRSPALQPNDALPELRLARKAIADALHRVREAKIALGGDSANNFSATRGGLDRAGTLLFDVSRILHNCIGDILAEEFLADE